MRQWFGMSANAALNMCWTQFIIKSCKLQNNWFKCNGLGKCYKNTYFPICQTLFSPLTSMHCRKTIAWLGRGILWDRFCLLPQKVTTNYWYISWHIHDTIVILSIMVANPNSNLRESLPHFPQIFLSIHESELSKRNKNQDHCSFSQFLPKKGNQPVVLLSPAWWVVWVLQRLLN